MNFERVLGKVDPKLVAQAEKKLSQVFIELGTGYSNKMLGSKMGGDPFIFSLIFPVQHFCTLSMPTAATDGRRFFWNPKFVIKKSIIGLRILCYHEACHAIYLHPIRRGSRIPRLWNFAVDYIVNGMAMDDFKSRNMDAVDMFTQHLGKFRTVEQYAAFLKDPFKKHEGFGQLDPNEADERAKETQLPCPDVDRDLTDAEKKTLERKEDPSCFYFADPNLEGDMRRPEVIYDYFYSLLPKCPKCGRVGRYKRPKKDQSQKDQSQEKEDKEKEEKESKEGDQPKDQPGDSQPSDNGEKSDQPGQDPSDQPGNCCDDSQSGGCGCGDPKSGGCCGDDGSGGFCDECDDDIDILGIGDTLDEHMSPQESQEKMAKRLSDARECARKMAGKVPSAMEDELGALTAPKITWQDVIRTRLLKIKSGNGRNDWSRFKTRPMFSGLLVPKRRSYYTNFCCLLDTSGSMDRDDMAFGISQLCSLDDKAEGTIVPADADIYWDKATKIKKANKEELSKVKICGRGGTVFGNFTSDYSKHVGPCDFLIIITDGFLIDQDVASMVDPGIPVYWIITSNSGFHPPFGRAFNIRNN